MKQVVLVEMDSLHMQMLLASKKRVCHVEEENQANNDQCRRDFLFQNIIKSTEVQTLGALRRARVSKRMRRTTNLWAGFSFSCYSWSLASSRTESDTG